MGRRRRATRDGVFGAPGSFYGRLFPARMLHLVCASSSVHWLSKVTHLVNTHSYTATQSRAYVNHSLSSFSLQVPQELVDGVLVNKGNVWAGRTSLPTVTAAYAGQFEHDFNHFLALRAEEIVPGGLMVLSLPGNLDMISEFIAEVLQDMASQVHEMYQLQDSFVH